MSHRRGNLRSMTGSVELQQDPGGPVVVISGDADLRSAVAVDEALQVAGADHDRVIVDLAAATLIDSRTIGVLIDWVERLRARGGDLPIVCPDSDVLRLFRTIGLEGSFSFFPTREAVLAADAGSSI